MKNNYFRAISVAAMLLTTQAYAQSYRSLGPIAGKRFALVAYQNDGTLDKTFGIDGRAITVFPGSTSQGPVGVTVDSQKRIVVAGTIDKKVAIVRYTSAGKLDKTFNGTGILLTDFNMGVQVGGHAIVALPDDSLLISAWYAHNNNLNDKYADFAHINSSGQYLPGFGAPYFGIGEEARAIAATSSANMTAAYNGQCSVPDSLCDNALYIYSQDLGGLVYNFIPGPSVEKANALKFDAQGRLLAGGSVTAFGGQPMMQIMRFAKTGAQPKYPYFDSTFGENGISPLHSFSGQYTGDDLKALTLDSSGRIVVAGSATLSKREFGVARLKSDGYPDPTFGAGVGKVLTGIGDDAVANGVAAVNSAIYAVGTVTQGTQKSFAVVKYTATGATDNTFNGTGIAITQAGCSGNSEADAVAVQDFSTPYVRGTVRVIAVGRTETNTCQDGIVAVPIPLP